MRHYTTFVILTAAMSATPARSAVFVRDWKEPGDGLLTYDDVNQREWLDLTETQLFKFPGDTLQDQYQAVIAETMSGGFFSDFVAATENEVRALAESAGINTSTLAFVANGDVALNIIDLVGDTKADMSGNTRSGGFVATTSGELASVWLVFNAFGLRGERNAGFRDLSGSLEPDFGFFGPPPLLETSGAPCTL